jgi:starch synthase
MEILSVSTELAPFAKVGGLADVAAALSKALRGLGHQVTLVLPRFPAFEAGGLLLARRLTPLKFNLGERAFDATVFDGRLASQVDLVLIDIPGLFDRAGIYGERGEDYPDNAIRFAAFSRAVAEVVRQRQQAGAPTDVVHLHDWPTCLVATYLADRRNSDRPPPKTVLTIHNIAHQGVFPKEAFAELGLPPQAFGVEGAEFFGKVNVLKQGIMSADVVTTVSTTYADEIQTAAGGQGLDGVLRGRGSKLIGIVNGVDYSVWNPATDPSIPARYDAEDMSPRMRCRGALFKTLGFPVGGDEPLIGFVGRLVPQKGIDLLVDAIPRLLRATNACFVVAGDGDARIVARLEEQAANSHGRMVFAPAASEPLVHQIFAGADLICVPSRYEPCGLVQLYAQRYGAIPIARATGGLVDTVVDCDAKLETGTGFLFRGESVDDLVGAVERALAARALREWPLLVRRVMRIDRGWDRPARQYEQVFRGVLAG